MQRKKAGLQHHYNITSIVEKHNIPGSLVINSDQTLSKYLQVECCKESWHGRDRQ